MRNYLPALLGFFCAANLFALPQENFSAAELNDADFQSLVEKTNLYVAALNAVSSAERSYQRYASWVDVKTGPTGKERYISYGLDEIDPASQEEIQNAALKGVALKPALPDLDQTIMDLNEAMTSLVPLAKKAHDYYAQEKFKDDNAAGAKEMHAALMPLFEKTLAAQRTLRRELDTLKAQLDQRQLARVEQISGRKYEWHLRNFLLKAKALVNLLPEKMDAPTLSGLDYNGRQDELAAAFDALEKFCAENPGDMREVANSNVVDSAVKNFFAASKSLRQTLEELTLDRRVYYVQLGELARSYNDLVQRSNSLR